MKTFPTQACSPALLARLRALAGADGVLSFRDFMAEALYAPGIGYYARKNALRVGRQPQADFYTSSSLSGGVFGRLVKAAAAQILAPEKPGKFALMEIAAEPGKSIFTPDATPFAHGQTRYLGDVLTIPPQSAVFANEWLDAQPFHRLVFRRGTWRELGVQINEPELIEVELTEFSPPALTLLNELPAETAEDYHLDISLEAENQLRQLVALPWNGCLMLADYGHDWRVLTHERPAGTGRAYYKHEVSGELLAQPGEQDLTCHVCWDRLEKILREHGFDSISVERQEAFFVRHANREIEQILAQGTGHFSAERQTVLELLHPAHLGQKFQILSARRIQR